MVVLVATSSRALLKITPPFMAPVHKGSSLSYAALQGAPVRAECSEADS